MLKVINGYGVEIDFDAAVALMNDAIREYVCNNFAPCTKQEFFDEYCRRDADFELAKQNP